MVSPDGARNAPRCAAARWVLALEAAAEEARLPWVWGPTKGNAINRSVSSAVLRSVCMRAPYAQYSFVLDAELQKMNLYS